MEEARTPDAQDALFAWLAAHGARFPGAVLGAEPGMGWGLVAQEALEPEDEILLVPRDLWFTRKTRHTRHRALVNRAHEADIFAHSMSRLALLLALERATPDSTFRPYLDALGAPTVPYTLDDDERAACQGLSVLDWIDEQRDLTAQEAERVRAVLRAHAPTSLQDGLSTDAWRWAYGHVMQRTFSVDLDDEEVWVLVPGMDLCNHAAAPNARYYAEEDGWLLEASRTVTAGEQITIHYGRAKTSCDLFLYYGFVPPEHHNDRVHLELELPEADPDFAEKSAAIELLGLQTDALVRADGAVPSAFLHAAILWNLDSATFRATQPNVDDPRHAVAALTRIADALHDAVAAFPTSVAEDEALTERGQPGWLPAITAYRRNVKRVMRSACDALQARAADARAHGWQPTDVVEDDSAGRYALHDVTVRCGAAAPTPRS